MSDLLDGDTRRDAIRVMLRFLADYYDDGAVSLSDAERAERVAEIGNLCARLVREEQADGLIASAECVLDDGDVGKARRLYGDAERFVGAEYPDLIALGTSIWLADDAREDDETHDDASDADAF